MKITRTFLEKKDVGTKSEKDDQSRQTSWLNFTLYNRDRKGKNNATEKNKKKKTFDRYTCVCQNSFPFLFFVFSFLI